MVGKKSEVFQVSFGVKRLPTGAFCPSPVIRKSSDYSDVHDQLHPPLWRALQNFKFGTRIQSRLVATNCT